MDLGIYVQNLNDDERCECYHHDIGKTISEHEKTEHENQGALEYALPEPDAEGLDIHTSSFLKCLVEWWIAEHAVHICIFIKDQREHWQRCVDRGVTKHQESIINWNCHKVEHDCESCLHHRNYQTPMKYELGQDRGGTVRLSAMP